MPRRVVWEPPVVPFRVDHVPVNRQYLRRAAAKGGIVRLAPGVYVGAAGVATSAKGRHLQMALAYQLQYPTPIVASHETAAAALDLPLPDSEALPNHPRFTLDPSQGSRRHRRPRIKVVALPERQVVALGSGPCEGLRVTDYERTALDLAEELPLPFALMALDAVARRRALQRVKPKDLRGAVDKRIIRNAMARLKAVESGLGPRGSRRRREALALVDPRHESPAESASAGHIWLAGLPPPLVQVRFPTSRGEYFCDFYWPEARVAGECDGTVKYKGGDSRVGQEAADRRRINEKRRALALEREHGMVVVPWFGYEALYQPEAFLWPLSDALRGRGMSW